MKFNIWYALNTCIVVSVAEWFECWTQVLKAPGSIPTASTLVYKWALYTITTASPDPGLSLNVYVTGR